MFCSRGEKSLYELLDENSTEEFKCYDVEFIVENETVGAFKAIMAANSPFFDRLLFAREYKEYFEKRVSIGDVKKLTFERIVKFCYNQQLELFSLNAEELRDLMFTANRFQVSALQNSIRRYVLGSDSEFINEDNYNYWLLAADKISDQLLVDGLKDILKKWRHGYQRVSHGSQSGSVFSYDSNFQRRSASVLSGNELDSFENELVADLKESMESAKEAE